MKKEVTALNTRSTLVENPEVTPMTMIERAMASGSSVEVMEKLMGLQERWEANRARRAFEAAMTAAKASMPVIVKENAKTGAGGSYMYEDLATIARAIDGILAAEGLSYRFRTESNGTVKVTCIISHRDGHSEENSLSSAPDTSGSKNSIQAIGSAVTYLQRYTLKAALGLAAAKDDDAAAAVDVAKITVAQLGELTELADEVKADKKRFCEFMKVGGIAEIPASQFARAKAALESKRRAK